MALGNQRGESAVDEINYYGSSLEAELKKRGVQTLLKHQERLDDVDVDVSPLRL